MYEYQNVKTFLRNCMFQIGWKKFLQLQKLKIVCHEHTLLMILTICQNVLQKRSTKSKSKRAQNRKK